MTLKQIATKLGLTAIGIANTGSSSLEFDHLNDWLKAGYNGKMAFIARDPERRCDVSKVMPGCKTVIVAAMRYDKMPANPARLEASKVKYLQHEDYHIVMMKKLEEIAAELKKEHPSASFKCYVDTGPVLEKTWAAKAGLGFIGKNTLLISPEHGSQMALGVVLTSGDVRGQRSEVGDLTSDFRPPISSACGSCTKCIDTCPTKALVAPYILDARKCISYKFFIEKEDGGCDVCQDICPFNKETL